MTNKTKRLIAVILYGLAMIIWIINCILHFVYDTSDALKIINTLCALLWCIGFLIQIYRYRNGE